MAKLYCQDVLEHLQYGSDKLINFYLLNEKYEFVIIEQPQATNLSKHWRNW